MMRITLNQNEIEQALRNYVAGQGIELRDKQVEVTLTAGRGANGFYAELSIQAKDCPVEAYSVIGMLVDEEEEAELVEVAPATLPTTEPETPVPTNPAATEPPRSLFDV